MQEAAYTGDTQLQGEMLVLRYVPLDAARQWDRNPKKHDLQKLVESIETYGFKDPPAYDVQLDAFVEGNGRTEALQWMSRHGRPRPRGIALDPQTGTGSPMAYAHAALTPRHWLRLARRIVKDG